MKRPVRTLLFTVVVLVTVVLAGSVQAATTAVQQTAAQSPAVQSPQVAQPVFPTPDQSALQALGGDEKPVLENGALVAPEDLVFAQSEPVAPLEGIEFQAAPDSPTITVWYGTNQQFGANGDPQKWVNILGRVTNPAPITSLTYSLNGGPPQSLNRGPDQRRLTQAGDFIIEIDYTKLQDGPNQVAITATDGVTTPTVANVTINYDAGNNSWSPGTYTFDWSTASTINDHGQVVTGEWLLNQPNGTVRPVLLSYDRLLALGDLTWRDYTVTVPVKINSYHDSGFPAPSNGPAVGVLVRWQGHFDLNNILPRVGWRRLGALAWYRWSKSGDDITSGMQLLGHGGINLAENGRAIDFGETYIFKVNIQSNAGNQPATYRFKMWDVTEAEPAAWDFEEAGRPGEPDAGSIILLAHHVDAEFGTVTVNLNSTQPLPKLTVNTTGNGQGSVTRTPSKNSYLFGEPVQLTAVPAAGSSFAGWSGAVGGTANPVTVEMFDDQTVTAIFTSDSAPDTPASDDFSGCALNNNLWTFIDPLGDSTLTLNGTQAVIGVPSGTKHDLWTDGRNAPRLMQFIEDKDFELETKFDSTLNARIQIQGMLIEADANNYIRVNFQWDNTNYKVLAYTFSNGSPTKRIDTTITNVSPIYMQVKRVGDEWTVRYSADGTAWTPLTPFTFAMNPTSAGVFIGTAGQNPAFTGLIDYFFNTDSPIDPEDGPIALNVTTVGDGSVDIDPDKSTYTCGEEVTLTATPDPGWAFTGWSGDASGTNPMITVTMDRAKSITANFQSSSQYTLTVNAVNGTVEKDPDQPSYGQGQVVTLTAVPDLGYQFSGWSGALTGTTNPATITMNSDKTITANFTQAPPRTLTITENGPGEVTVVPDKPTYLNGEVVTLTATPTSPGYSFAGWGGDLSGSENPATVVMEGNKVISANFFLDQYTLDVTPAGSGSGTVNKSPDKPLYYQGEVVTLTAVPNADSVFIGWSGDVTSAASPVTVTMTGNKAVTATFAEAGGYSLTVNKVGDGQVTVSPQKAEYDFGDLVTLTATPDSGAFFAGWSGDLTGNQNPATITIDADTVITATFGGAGDLVINVATIGQGTVKLNPEGPTYSPGQQVSLTATGEIGHRFVSWGGDINSTDNPLVVTVNQNLNLTATFQQAPTYTLNLSTDGNGTAVAVVTNGPNHPPPYLHGEIVRLAATPGDPDEYRFAGWTGDVVSNANPAQLLMDGNKTVMANFTNSDAPLSDDFSGCVLNNQWTFVNPRDQGVPAEERTGSYEINGSQAIITILGQNPETGIGVDHNIWKEGNFTARLMQPAANTDFVLEAKFESAVTQRYQIQGIVVEQTPGRFLRFDFFSDGTNPNESEVHVYAASVDVQNNIGRARRNIIIEPDPDDNLYLRVQRIGDRWFLWYSFDGQNWETTGGNFTDVLQVSRVGVYAGSTGSGGSIPGHTAVIDYFFNNASPIDFEDGNAGRINVSIEGQGRVERDPDQDTYTCGQQVELRAVPNPGWRFIRWSGDLNGANPVASLTVNGPRNVTAVFAPTQTRLYMPAVLR